jgi:hypothetical protein
VLGALSILSLPIKYRKICKRILGINISKILESQVSVANLEKLKMENVFLIRICDLRIFESQGNSLPIAFEERKIDKRIESNSTFQFPSKVSLTGIIGTCLMQ